MAFHAELVPSTANAIGMKGCGEAGTVGALAAVTNATLDALWDAGRAPRRHADDPAQGLGLARGGKGEHGGVAPRRSVGQGDRSKGRPAGVNPEDIGVGFP